MEKTQTRELAHKYGLRIADKPDSQDICFVPNGGYANLVKKLRPESIISGNIVDLEGNILGKHDGIINYTIGQRKGIGIGGRKGSTQPLYVIELRPEQKEVVVGPHPDTNLKIPNINMFAPQFAQVWPRFNIPGGPLAKLKIEIERSI